MASAGTRAAAAAALLFFLAAVLFFFLLQAPPPGLAGLVASALEMATRRNMILLCHAILLVILRDAGVLGTPASSRGRSPPGEATAAVAQTACSVVAPARPQATRTPVVWRRRRPMPDAAAAAAARRRLVECQPAAEAAPTTRTAQLLTTGPPAQAAEEDAAVALATVQIVLAEESSSRNDGSLLHHHHGHVDIVEHLEHPAAIAADGETDCDDGRIIAAAADDEDTAREQQTEGKEMEMELADDRAFEEFIESQRRMMRQESLQLQLVSSG